MYKVISYGSDERLIQDNKQPVISNHQAKKSNSALDNLLKSNARDPRLSLNNSSAETESQDVNMKWAHQFLTDVNVEISHDNDIPSNQLDGFQQVQSKLFSQVKGLVNKRNQDPLEESDRYVHDFNKFPSYRNSEEAEVFDSRHKRKASKEYESKPKKSKKAKLPDPCPGKYGPAGLY